MSTWIWSNWNGLRLKFGVVAIAYRCSIPIKVHGIGHINVRSLIVSSLLEIAGIKGVWDCLKIIYLFVMFE